tara:strand:- start:1470 stop:2054 length:585 start_codon:yes stop_codon:yes gene_type:complete
VTLSPAYIENVLNGIGELKNSSGNHIAAGVLVLLFDKNGEYWVILNKRTQKVEHHKGEICFPGGRKDRLDKDLTETALRETWEEMGISPGSISVLGVLGKTETTTGYQITPTVGLISYPYQFNIQNDEVEEIIEMPLSTLFSDDSKRDEAKILEGEVIMQPAFHYEDNMIFGATARILNSFACLIDSRNLKEPA